MRSMTMPSSSYQVINILTGAVIILIFAYSAVFNAGSSDYPLECAHVLLYGQDCRACGLSRSFSEMIRGNFASAVEYNKNGPMLFIFFGSQLLMRSFTGLILLRPVKIRTKPDTQTVLALQKEKDNAIDQISSDKRVRAIALSDMFFSSLLFLWCFRNLLVFW